MLPSSIKLVWMTAASNERKSATRNVKGRITLEILRGCTKEFIVLLTIHCPFLLCFYQVLNEGVSIKRSTFSLGVGFKIDNHTVEDEIE